MDRCKDCGAHTDVFFDMTKSTTAKFATCKEFSACNSCSEDRCYISQVYLLTIHVALHMSSSFGK